MNYGSVCSGIEAASAAWHPLGWRAAWFSEIEPFPSAVLAHRFPTVPNLGDMTKLPKLVLTGKAAAPDVLVGGTPCQAFSVAGLREGLNDPRGQLTIKFVELADAIDHVRVASGDAPAVIVWENVPGVLSDKSNAFGCFLGALAGESCELQPPGGKWPNAGCVFGPARAIAWRILDAQFFGVAQRRRRVFVVASARDGFHPAQVLFEFGGVRRDTPPRRGKGPTVAALTANGVGTCGADDNQGQAGHLIPAAGCWWDGGQVSQTLDAVLAKGQTMPEKNRFPAVLQPISFRPTQDPISSTDGTTHAMGCGSSGGQASVAMAFSCKDHGDDAGDLSPTLRAMGHAAVAVSLRGREGGATAELGDEVQNCLRASGGGGDKAHVLVSLADTLHNKGIATGDIYASTQEAYPKSLLRTLRQEIREKAFTEWGLGILDSLQQAEILQQALHGISVRPATFSRSWVVYCALSREEDRAGWLLQSLREAGCERCASQGWQPPEQLSRELGAYLSELSCPGAQAARFMHDLWEASQGIGVLRQALSAVQEAWQPAYGEGKSAHGGMLVRRLTVEECEFLQGFPRGYTRIPWRNKPASDCPDGPRYKAIGNSMAVPVMAWIGARIDAVINTDRGAA